MRKLFALFSALVLQTAAFAGISSFIASPLTVSPGQDAALTWNVTSGDSISIDQGVQPITGATGSVTVRPLTTTIYTLTNATSGTTATATVSVLAPTQLRNRWSFNEGSGADVNDSIGTAHATIRGTTFTRSATQAVLPGGASASAAYVDLPNGLISTLNEVTIEGWMTINGSQTNSRIFDFGTGSAGELNAPGGSASSIDSLSLSGQVGSSLASKRLSMKDGGSENLSEVADAATLGQQFHFAVVYSLTANGGAPLVRYYKNGALFTSLNTTFRLPNISDLNSWLGRSNVTSDANINGAYNEFRIWNGALSAAAIADTSAAGPDALPTAPHIDSFAVFPSTTILAGASVRLSYLLGDNANGPVTASISNGVGILPNNAGFVTVTPAATTTYTLTASNGPTTRTASVTVVVAPSAPVAENGTSSAGYQLATPLTLIAHDPNTALNLLTYTIVTPPAHGTLTGTGVNRTYTPEAGYAGADSFTFKASDGSNESNVATVTITVNPAPVAPTDILPSEPALFTNYTTGSFAARLRASDGNPDDRFVYALVSGAGDTHNAFFTISGNQLVAQHDFAGDLGLPVSIRVRVTDLAGNQFEKVIGFSVQLPPQQVKINEINYNPSRNTIRGEFIELYNPLATAVNLGGWSLTKGIDFTFPAGATIPPNGYLVIAEDPTIIQALYGVAALGPWSGGLSSDGDEVVLRDASTTVVDRVEYGITSPWPVPSNGDGPSMELLNPTAENDLGGNWRASVTTPTAVTYFAAGSANWRYRKGTSEASTPTSAWRAEGFVENATWLTGTAPIGLFKQNSNSPTATLPEFNVTLSTQLADMATYSGTFTAAYRSVFFRKTFTVADPIPRAVLLRVMHNDAAIVWINGQEVGRFGFTPDAPAEPTIGETRYYEQGNDPWSETVLLNAGALLHPGMNTIAIQGFAKLPVLRTTQDDAGNYNVFDFCIDAELKNVPELLGTPGAQNSVFTANPPPAIRNVDHVPVAPHSWDAITFTARVTDPQGVGAVQLSYQICAPGNYIPAILPLTASQLLNNPTQPLQANAAFESAANWTTIPMVDDGSVPGDLPGDGIFTARLSARPNRTLVRYRITATDLGGASVRIPTPDDPRKNYALFVYDGVPTYTASGKVFAPSELTSVPVYQWITRAADFSTLLAYNSNEQFPNSIDLKALLARRVENWEGALVFNDQVVDHVLTRLRGGNSRYAGTGKRHFRFKFPKGTPLYAADERGELYPRPWEEMLFNKMFGNKGYYDFGIPFEVGGQLWRQQGVPIPDSHWVHFRVVRSAAEAATPTTGDFFGLYQALELPEGKNFLRARDLPLGNFYKMSDWTQNGEMNERYQAEGAPDFGEDFDNIRYNIHQTASESFVKTFVNMPLWNRYNAVQEAIRHYDIFVEPTGRHRVKNLIWYFEPQVGNWLGRVWFMPYDWDASFGPNWNEGQDFVHNAIYDDFDIADSPTWQLPKQNRTTMQIERRNAIREMRDLVWYRDSATNRGPFDDLLDDSLATISAIWPADRVRWPATGAVADYAAGAPAKVQDMKNFAFSGWTDTLSDGSPSVGAGGRAAYLDSISDALDTNQLPAKPTITYTGASGFPVDGITLQSSNFSDPQGAASFAAMQWRVGEVTDPGAPFYNPAAERIYEVIPVWGSGELTVFNASIAVPGSVLRVGHAYRARVRHKDNTGRWGHWSAPLPFIAGASNYLQVLKDNLVISELMYHPAAPGAGEGAFTENDFEFIELRNVSTALTLDLSNVRFTKGVDFNFAGSAITSLAPGATVLVVKNIAAFNLRYGTGKPLAGVWNAADNFSNSSEEVKLSLGAGVGIHSFTYDDDPPWPTKADDGSHSLVLRNPESRPDHALPGSWRASYVRGGTPGGDDRTSYDAWAAAHNVTDMQSDLDGDGLSALLEYALRGDPAVANRELLPPTAILTLNIGNGPEQFLTMTIRRAAGAEDVTFGTEWSSDLVTWTTNGVLLTSSDQGDGTILEIWRAPLPVSAGRCFGRLRITRQQ